MIQARNIYFLELVFLLKIVSLMRTTSAKAWFKEAYLLEKEEKTSKALSLYEKFTKRRSDAIFKN